MEAFVELFEVPYGREAQCGKCGGSVEFIECDSCEEGLSYHDCGEDCCNCIDPQPNVICDNCEGNGGWWHCSTCETNTTKEVSLENAK